MKNGWSVHAYIQVINLEGITLNQAIRIFKRMDISEYIFEVVVEPSNKKNIKSEATCDVHIRNMRGRYAVSKINIYGWSWYQAQENVCRLS